MKISENFENFLKGWKYFRIVRSWSWKYLRKSNRTKRSPHPQLYVPYDHAAARLVKNLIFIGHRFNDFKLWRAETTSAYLPLLRVDDSWKSNIWQKKLWHDLQAKNITCLWDAWSVLLLRSFKKLKQINVPHRVFCNFTSSVISLHPNITCHLRWSMLWPVGPGKKIYFSSFFKADSTPIF